MKKEVSVTIIFSLILLIMRILDSIYIIFVILVTDELAPLGKTMVAIHGILNIIVLITTLILNLIPRKSSKKSKIIAWVLFGVAYVLGAILLIYSILTGYMSAFFK